MDNIVKFSEIPEYIKETIFGIKHGLYLAESEGGVIADTEMDIQFNMLVVDDEGWQVLDVVSSRETEGTTNDGGGQTSTTTSQGNKVSDGNTVSNTESTSDGDIVTIGTDRNDSNGTSHDETSTTSNDSANTESVGSSNKSSNSFMQRTQNGTQTNQTSKSS